MELQVGRVTGQFERNAVLAVNGDSAGADPAARPRDMDLLVRQLDIVTVGLLDNGRANVLFRARGVGGLQGFGLDRILELVVREIRWDDFNAHQDYQPEDGQTED